MVRLVTQVMWYPRATSPYMLPRASPVTRSWMVMGSGVGFALRLALARALPRGDRNDLAALPHDHDVVLVRQGVVLLGREGSLVRLDQALVLALQALEGIPDLGPVGGAGLLDGEGDEMEAVIRIGRAHGGDDVARFLDAVLLAQHLEHVLPALVLLAEEGVGLQEGDAVGEIARQLGEAPARDAPVRDHGRVPAELGLGAQDLGALGG